ncbi:MAG: hypothetical protein ABL918_12885, partial [Chakrabartia sp.]
DAAMTTSRSECQINYRYERRFDYQKNVSDQDVHSGLARGRFDLIPKVLSMEAGALAARSRSDIRGAAPLQGVGNIDNVTQVYSAFAGPTLATRVGPLDVTAAYRLGYTAVDAGRTVSIPGGQPALDKYDDSINHFATASVGMDSGSLPFGWTVSGSYEREDAGQLDQRFESKYIRGDVVVPVTPTVALVGGVGYEDIESSQRDALLYAGGNVAVDAKGRFITDPTSPRRLAYDQDGMFFDAGVLWKPSRRTSLEARVGRRYGSLSYTGAFSWQMTSNSGFQVGIFDTVETFGQQLNDNLSRLPTSYSAPRNRLVNTNGGCVFGGQGSGGCLNDAFQSINTAAYRSRGVSAVWTAGRGPWKTGVGVGYVRRDYSAPIQAGVFSVNGLTDQSWYAQGNVDYALSDHETVSGDVVVSYYEPGITGAGDVLSTGATGSYNRTFGRNLSAGATLGLYSYRQDNFDSNLTVSAFAGMRYSF